MIKERKMQGICKFCGKHTQIIQSHIIPKSFYHLRKWGAFSGIYPAECHLDKVHAQNGFKSSLLCKECDNHLGIFDAYACYFLYTFVPTCRFDDSNKLSPVCKIKFLDFNYYKLKYFFISLVWRASVCDSIPYSLGLYEKTALNILKYLTPEQESLFVPLIYRKETNHAVDQVVAICQKTMGTHKYFYFRFLNYEVIVLTDIHQIRDKNLAMEWQNFFTYGEIKIHKITTYTPLDKLIIKSREKIAYKYGK